jgi:hypothetical protein
MATFVTIKNIVPADLVGQVPNVDSLVEEFVADCEPLEKDEFIYVFVDARTGARFCECHILASKLVPLATIDVPLDPEEQQEYRANREMVTAHQAFEDMKDDADQRRSFCNLVLEYLTDYDADHPLKMIGGQHRYTAIKEALEKGIDEQHGVKVYFGLNPEQRLDVQLISNTVIEVSPDLLDRMQETLKGPQLRDWCKSVGLVKHDFADKRQRGKEITVAAARSFILNYNRGKALASAAFEQVETTPQLSRAGVVDVDFEKLRRKPNLLNDAKLSTAFHKYDDV